MRARALAALLPLLLAGCASAPRDGGGTRVEIDGTRWLVNGRPTHPGSPAEGLLTNVRMVNAVFEDPGPAAAANAPGFDPEANTDRFIRRIPEYVAQGVSAFTVSLQGGLPGYEGAVNSAFEADGSLRPAYMARVARVIEAADRAGAVIVLSLLYQRQHSHPRALAGREAVLAAVENAARWVGERGDRNVVLEVANEFAHGGYRRWTDGTWLVTPEAQAELIRHAKRAAPGLLVSTSGMGDAMIPDAVGEAADFVLVHLNGTPPDSIAPRVARARRFGKPVVVNEDDKIGEAGARSAEITVAAGAGWGFMHSEKNQHVPFEFDGAADDPLVYAALRRLTTPGAALTLTPPGQPFALVWSPKDGDVLERGSRVTIRASVSGPTAPAAVEFLANGRVIGTTTAGPWETRWNAPEPGRYDLAVVVRDRAGSVVVRSRPVDVEVRR